MRINALKSWMLLGLFAPATLLAQKGETEKPKEKKEGQQIIITRKGDNKEKIVVEIGEKGIFINGKPAEDYKEGDIKVMIKKLKDLETLTFNSGGDNWSWSPRGGGANMFGTVSENRAMLGVTSEQDEKGVRITNVTKESAAEKIGLKEGDVITKIDDAKIEDPDDLSATITKHKPGDKVSVTWLRDKKEQKATAELGKWRGGNVFGSTSPMEGFQLENLNRDIQNMMPRMQELQRYKEFQAPFAQGWSWSGNGPKLGLSVQDTDEGKGVKVIEVDEESNAAKAGIKEEDIITEVDGKAVNSTDEMVKLIKENREKTSVMIKLQRDGKTLNMEVKMPRKIKTADL